MKKKIGSAVMGLAFAVFAVFLAAEGAEAFCVYNNTNVKICVKTSGFAGMLVEYLPPGGKACCHWSNKDCNPNKKRDSNVNLWVTFERDGGRVICSPMIKAGGWLTVDGDINKQPIWQFDCQAHYSE